MKLVALFNKLLETEGQCHRRSVWKYLTVGGGWRISHSKPCSLWRLCTLTGPVHVAAPCCGWLMKTSHLTSGLHKQGKLNSHIPCGVELLSCPSPLSCWSDWQHTSWPRKPAPVWHKAHAPFPAKAYAVFLAWLLRRQTKLGICCKAYSVWSRNRAITCMFFIAGLH